MNNNAHFLIDPITKFRFPRELILNREYTDDPGVEALVIQRAYQRPPDGVHRLSMEVDGAEGPSARPEPGAPGRSCASVMSPAASALGAPAAEEVEQAPVQPEAQQLPAHPVPEEHQEGGEGEERMEGPCKRHRMDLARNDLAHALQMLLPRWAATAMRSSSSTLGSRQASDAIKCGSD